MIIFLKTVDENLNNFEKILSVVTLHGSVTGEVIFEAIKTRVFDIVDKSKMSSICTDGARVLTGKNKGLVGLLMKNGITCPAFHCIIHQQALYSKEIKMVQTMDVAIKIINKIKGGHNALTHRRFKSFLDYLKADYGDLILFTEARWLSHGKSLERLFNVRKEVLIFLKESNNEGTNVLITSLEDPDFQLNLAFLCDMTSILNELNLVLQGKNLKIFQLVTAVEHFGRKLQMLIRELDNNILVHLNKTAYVYSELNFDNSNKIHEYSEIVKSLYSNYQARFQRF